MANPEKVKKCRDNWRKNNETRWRPQKYAQNTVQRAVKEGKLKRPKRCQRCRKKRKMIQGHHYKGYAIENRLEVRWLCAKCHRIEEKIIAA